MRSLSTPQETYLLSLFGHDLDEHKQRAQKNAQELGLGGISLSAYEGALLRCLLRPLKPQRICEIGTLTGHSALWLMESLSAGGTMVTLEKDETRSRLAKAVLEPKAQELGLQWQEFTGDAISHLSSVAALGPFCGVFVDANKSQYLTYWDFARQNLRAGGLFVADNVFLSGAVVNGESEKFSKKQISILREFNQTIARDPDFETIILPTSEGLLLSYKK